MKQEVIEKTYELIEQIKDTPKYKRLMELKRIIDTDSNVQELIQSFQKWNKKYEEVSKYGKYHPDLRKVQLSFRDAKEKLYTNEVVEEYKSLENDLQKELDHISASIAQAISKKIKHPNEIGLINKH